MTSVHALPALPGKTVRVGVIDAAFPPVPTVASGDEVEMTTLGLWAGRITPDMDRAAVWRIRSEYQGVGPHSLTGPIEVAGAEQGDVLRVDILAARPAPHGFNIATPGAISRGVLAHRFPDGFVRHFATDADAGVDR